MKEIYIIGDVHGQINTLKKLIDKIPKGSKIVFTGDLIDRGISSKEVLEFIIDNKYETVLGNHEDFMIQSIDKITGNIAPKEIWFQKCNGGEKTFASYYNDRNNRKYPKEFQTEKYRAHVDYLKKLPLFLYYEIEGVQLPLVISHSFIQPFWKGKDSKMENFSLLEKQHILWDRMNKSTGEVVKRFELDYHNNIYNVFGHTPFKDPVICKYSAAIDCGAIYNNKLIAFKYPDLTYIEQENIDPLF